MQYFIWGLLGYASISFLISLIAILIPELYSSHIEVLLERWGSLIVISICSMALLLKQGRK